MSTVGPCQNLTSRMSDVWLFKDIHEWQISKKYGGGSHGLKTPFWHLQAHINETTKQSKYCRHVPPCIQVRKLLLYQSAGTTCKANILRSAW